MQEKLPADLLIRQANSSDLEKIESLMKLSIKVLGQGHYNLDQIESSCKYVCVPDRQIIEDGTYYVVEDINGTMLGCGGWSFRYTLCTGPTVQENQSRRLDPQKDMARIRAMFVLGSASGKGVGSLILKTSEQAAKNSGFKRGALTATQSGLAFYKSKGWTSIKEDISLLPDGVNIEVTHMEKNYDSAVQGNNMLNKPIKETVVFITGASNGIGLAAAERFAKEGYIVIATARTPESRPNLLALAKKYPNLSIKKLDVTDSEENINALISSIKNIDILINNAGIGIVGVAESFSQKQIQQIINTNVYGVVNVTNAVLPDMRKRNCGMILTISSIVGPLPDMRQCFYSGSKAMVEHYTSQLKNDLKTAGYNITIANIHPGPVVTNFEISAPVGDRFNGRENPYPQMHTDVEKWRALMKEGRPVAETVDTIFKVVKAKKPSFWNPTESRVSDNFKAIYCDPTGEAFSKGPVFSKSQHSIKGMPILSLHNERKGKPQSASDSARSARSSTIAQRVQNIGRP